MTIDERSDLGVLVSCATIADIIATVVLAFAGLHTLALVAAATAIIGACLCAAIWTGGAA